MVIVLDGTFSNNLLEFTAVQVGLLSRTVHASFICTSDSPENVKNLFLNNPELEKIVLEFRNIILIRRMWLQHLQRIFPYKQFHFFQNIFGYTAVENNPNQADIPYNSSCTHICCRPPAPTVVDSQYSNVTVQKFAVFITERIFAPEVFASLLCYKGGVSNPVHLTASHLMMSLPKRCEPAVVEQPGTSKSLHMKRRYSSVTTDDESGRRSSDDFDDISLDNCATTLDELLGMIDRDELTTNPDDSPLSVIMTPEDVDESSSQSQGQRQNANDPNAVVSPYSPISPPNVRYEPRAGRDRDGTSTNNTEQPLDLRFPPQ